MAVFGGGRCPVGRGQMSGHAVGQSGLGSGVVGGLTSTGEIDRVKMPSARRGGAQSC